MQRTLDLMEMDSGVTYAELKFPTGLKETAKKAAGIKEDSQAHDEKKPPPKLLIALVFMICLLLAALLALITLYWRASVRLSQAELQMEPLRHNYTKVLEYINCKQRSSASNCDQHFRWICPEGWVRNESRCYFFSKNVSSWENSRSSCMQSRADLVIIGDQAEQDFIRSTKRPGFYWLGLTDMRHEEDWKWVDGSSLQQSVKFWTCKQPDNYQNKENCATVGSDALCQSSHDWNDDQCSKEYKFVCEKAADYGKLDFMPWN